MNYDDICNECSALGDDYFINEDGELECWCPKCWLYMMEDDCDAEDT